MALLLDHSPVSYFSETASRHELADAPLPCGSDGLELMQQYTDAFAQWSNRPSIAMGVAGDAETFRHVPFKYAGSIRVRFRQASPMKPRTMDVEDHGAE